MTAGKPDEINAAYEAALAAFAWALDRIFEACKVGEERREDANATDHQA